MPTISPKKREKISEQILHYLFLSSPSAKFTSEIAQEIARDEEFTKSLLKGLKSKSFVSEINKNSKGIDYLKRQRWILSPDTYTAYKQTQSNSSSQQLL